MAAHEGDIGTATLEAIGPGIGLAINRGVHTAKVRPVFVAMSKEMRDEMPSPPALQRHTDAPWWLVLVQRERGDEIPALTKWARATE